MSRKSHSSDLVRNSVTPQEAQCSICPVKEPS